MPDGYSLLAASGSGPQRLIGNNTDDVIVGNGQNDTVVPGSGNNTLTGGGPARFVISSGNNLITDFVKQDSIEVDIPNATIVKKSVANGFTTLDMDTIGDGLSHATVSINQRFGDLARSSYDGITIFSPKPRATM